MRWACYCFEVLRFGRRSEDVLIDTLRFICEHFAVPAFKFSKNTAISLQTDRSPPQVLQLGHRNA